MKILCGIPTYDRRIDIELFKCLIKLERLNKYEIDFLFPVSSHLSRNRNLCCKETINNKYDWLLFLDSDIGIIDETFIDKLLDTAYKFGAQIVGGAYRMKKNDELIYIAGHKKSDGKYDNIKQKPKWGLVNAVGTGIMIIAKQVLEKMPDPWFTIVDKPNLDIMPEDFEFCRKAEELGFKIAIDPRFETHHFGQFSWTHL